MSSAGRWPWPCLVLPVGFQGCAKGPGPGKGAGCVRVSGALHRSLDAEPWRGLGEVHSEEDPLLAGAVLPHQHPSPAPGPLVGAVPMHCQAHCHALRVGFPALLVQSPTCHPTTVRLWLSPPDYGRDTSDPVPRPARCGTASRVQGCREGSDKGPGQGGRDPALPTAPPGLSVPPGSQGGGRHLPQGLHRSPGGLRGPHKFSPRSLLPGALDRGGEAGSVALGTCRLCGLARPCHGPAAVMTGGRGPAHPVFPTWASVSPAAPLDRQGLSSHARPIQPPTELCIHFTGMETEAPQDGLQAATTLTSAGWAHGRRAPCGLGLGCRHPLRDARVHGWDLLSGLHVSKGTCEDKTERTVRGRAGGSGLGEAPQVGGHDGGGHQT